MARKTQLDLAIEKLDAEIAVLVSARERLVAQRDEAATKRALKGTTGE